MTLSLSGVLFLIAAVIFLLDAIAGWARDGWAYSARAHSLAFGLVTVALLLTHGK